MLQCRIGKRNGVLVATEIVERLDKCTKYCHSNSSGHQLLELLLPMIDPPPKTTCFNHNSTPGPGRGTGRCFQFETAVNGNLAEKIDPCSDVTEDVDGIELSVF